MKPKLHARQTALSFSEKIKILKKLRDRERAIAAAGLRKNVMNADSSGSQVRKPKS